jgi:hypothetical protein
MQSASHGGRRVALTPRLSSNVAPSPGPTFFEVRSLAENHPERPSLDAHAAMVACQPTENLQPTRPAG